MTVKIFHEIRDPIYVFIKLDLQEREVVDSRPFQRLRHIHQLGMTYLVYPGATHKRFEHSLGVMELAGKVYDIITSKEVHSEVKNLLPQLNDYSRKDYWRRIVRMAALCHDLGHLPFSHAAEKELLPAGWNHERLTGEIILKSELNEIWNKQEPPLKPKDIIKVALGPKELPDEEFSAWERILAEIITGDVFGVDRIDYLLRDSHHCGVAYGKFDHHRLIDTLCILPVFSEDGEISEVALGIEEGGLQSAEALLLARYFMYTQVYFHPVRRIYDIHLRDFLAEWLENGCFSVNLEKHLSLTDNEVTSAMLKAAYDPEAKGHIHASRIVKRKHFKLLYQFTPEDARINPDAGKAIYQEAEKEFGKEALRYDKVPYKSGKFLDFPVLLKDGRVTSAFEISPVLKNLPAFSLEYVFVDRKIYDKAMKWLNDNRKRIIENIFEAEEDNE